MFARLSFRRLRYAGSLTNSESRLPSICKSFASTPQDKDKSNEKKSITSRFGGFNGVVLGSAAVATASVSYLLYDVTYNFMSLTPAASLYYGFMAGAASAATAAGFGYLGERWSRLNPDRALAAAMKVIRANPKVADILGEGLTSGKMRSYNIQRGGISFKESFPKLYRPEIQLTFVLKGLKGSANVLVVYSVFGMREKLVYCGINYPSPTGGRVLSTALVGDKDYFTTLHDFKKHGESLSTLE